jgi:hypothetical protein
MNDAEQQPRGTEPAVRMTLVDLPHCGLPRPEKDSYFTLTVCQNCIQGGAIEVHIEAYGANGN